MMDINVNSPSDVRTAGIAALAEKLGPVGVTRFLQQFENGWGDYTKEKQECNFSEDTVAQVHSAEVREVLRYYQIRK
mgnify:CR=1 FL=1